MGSLGGSEDRPDIPLIDAGMERVAVCAVGPSRAESQPRLPRPRRVDHASVMSELDSVRLCALHRHPRERLRFDVVTVGRPMSCTRMESTDQEEACYREHEAARGVPQGASRADGQAAGRHPHALWETRRSSARGSRPFFRGLPRSSGRPVLVGGGDTECRCRGVIAALVGWLW